MAYSQRKKSIFFRVHDEVDCTLTKSYNCFLISPHEDSQKKPAIQRPPTFHLYKRLSLILPSMAGLRLDNSSSSKYILIFKKLNQKTFPVNSPNNNALLRIVIALAFLLSSKHKNER